MKAYLFTVVVSALVIVGITAAFLTTYNLGYAGEKGPWFADTEVARSGWKQFQEAGCAQCHSILGQQGQSAGPDLTYVGSRWTNPDDLKKFIRNPHAVFPNTMMPNFTNLSDDQLNAIVNYLVTLKQPKN